jgi:Plasmid stabilization system protein
MAMIVKRPRAEQEKAGYLGLHRLLDSFDRADEFLDRVEGKLQTLARNPGLGRRQEELLAGLHSFPIGNYVVFYREIENGIDVIRVLHGSRDIEDIFSRA